jgi:hypothetical protein
LLVSLFFEIAGKAEEFSQSVGRRSVDLVNRNSFEECF